MYDRSGVTHTRNSHPKMRLPTGGLGARSPAGLVQAGWERLESDETHCLEYRPDSGWALGAVSVLYNYLMKESLTRDRITRIV